MENSPIFHKLKKLHENLQRGNAFTTKSRQQSPDGKNLSEELSSKCDHNDTNGTSNNEPRTGGDGGFMKEPADLLKAVKTIYEGSKVELVPHKIFVGNISYKIATGQLKYFFKTFGNVVHAQIIKERGSKRSKGYGFVTFSKDSEVENVLHASDDELILDGRILRVNRAEKKRRGRPIQKLGSEIDPKASLQDFVRNYNQQTEEESVPSEQDKTTTTSKISILNNDILLHIFSFLNAKDRLKIERVSHRWLQLSRQSWHFIKHLDFKGIFGFSMNAPGLTDSILLSVFRRGCQKLRSLDLSHSPTLLTDYSLYLIRQHCSQLENLNLSGVNVTTKSLKDLTAKCCNLKKISLNRCHGVGEKGLWWLFKQSERLEYVDVGKNTRLTGQCFFMLTDKCTTVIANECIKLTDDGLTRLTQRCPNLQELNISNCLQLTDNGLCEVFKISRNLKKLEFCKSPKNVTENCLMELRNLSMLEELQLSEQIMVHDDILLAIAKNCPHLRFVNVAACHKLTDRGIQGLVCCLSLEKLNISYLDKITDISIKEVSLAGRLRVLHARSCFNLTDQAVEYLVSQCCDLQELDLSGTERIWKNSLDLIEMYFKDKTTFHLAVGGTGIPIEQAALMQERHQEWHITTLDMSDYHLRVDFDPLMDMGHILYEDDEENMEDWIDHEGLEEELEEYDAEYYVSAFDDDPSMVDEDGEWWMS